MFLSAKPADEGVEGRREAFAGDLNPVAYLILKVLLEDIPRHGVRLAEKLRRIGFEVKRLAENDLARILSTGSRW